MRTIKIPYYTSSLDLHIEEENLEAVITAKTDEYVATKSEAELVEEALANCPKNITVAIMGCVVNGPGEAKEADIGIAGGKNEALLFKKGQIICKVPEEEILTRLLKEIEEM